MEPERCSCLQCAVPDVRVRLQAKKFMREYT